MATRNEVTVGPNVKLNNLVMYRIVDDLPFIPRYFFDENHQMDPSNSSIIVNYKQYYKDIDGNIHMEEIKHYTVKGVKAIMWFEKLDRTPIPPDTNGILDEIEYILGILPMNVSSDYEIS